MKSIAKNTFNELLQGAKILKSRHFKPKVLEKGESIIKCFYRKREFSKRLLFPPAKKFYKNCQRLRQLGFYAPEIDFIAYVPSRRCHVLRYLKMPGRDLRELAEDNCEFDLSSLAKLIARLHQHGIYFRAIHLGNILQMPGNTLALIDVTDVRFKRRALSKRLRQRNLNHLFKHEFDQPTWQRYTTQRFLQEYQDAL